MEISSAHHHHQLMMSSTHHHLEEMLTCPKTQQQQQQLTPSQPQQQQQQQNATITTQDKKPRPQPDQAINCPRCDSSNTKFCYYNNYSLSQPRYFCKSCRRYWTQGGSLRNVPVGGGCRKNKRSSSSTSSSTSSSPSSSSSKKGQEQQPQFRLPVATNPSPLLPALLPPPITSYEHASHDLTLAFASLHKQHHENLFPTNPANAGTTNPSQNGFLDILRGDFPDRNNLSEFHNAYYGFGGHGGACGNEMALPFEGLVHGTNNGAPQGNNVQDGVSNSSKNLDGEESKVMMGLQWPLGVDAIASGTPVMDSSRDHYWNGGVGANSWHGIINSSLM